ncbi:MAG: hypothetical protein WB341_17860 [Terracidiphilus sp.]
MKFMTGSRTLLLIGLALGTAVSARAAGTYTITCDAERGGTLSIALTGFNLKVAGASEPAGTGMSKGTRSNAGFELTIRFAPGKDYETLLSMVQDNEVLRSCKLVDGAGGGTTATDAWTQMEAPKGKNKNKNNAPAASPSGGALEWILTNATVASVTAIGNETAAGVPENAIMATLEAQTFSFTM